MSRGLVERRLALGSGDFDPDFNSATNPVGDSVNLSFVLGSMRMSDYGSPQFPQICCSKSLWFGDCKGAAPVQ